MLVIILISMGIIAIVLVSLKLSKVCSNKSSESKINAEEPYVSNGTLEFELPSTTIDYKTNVISSSWLYPTTEPTPEFSSLRLTTDSRDTYYTATNYDSDYYYSSYQLEK